jgi:hypothetical protein
MSNEQVAMSNEEAISCLCVNTNGDGVNINGDGVNYQRSNEQCGKKKFSLALLTDACLLVM